LYKKIQADRLFTTHHRHWGLLHTAKEEEEEEEEEEEGPMMIEVAYTRI
jgi:hypothetical protein